MTAITAFLTYHDQAVSAASCYVSISGNLHLANITHYGEAR